MKIHCSCCARQVSRDTHTLKVGRNNLELTTQIGAVRGFAEEVICGYCAEELDENGMFPEEAALCRYLNNK